VTPEERQRVSEIKKTKETLRRLGTPDVAMVRIDFLLSLVESQEREIGNLKAGKIHTCHEDCQREVCVQARTIDKLLSGIERIREHNRNGHEFVSDAVESIARELLAEFGRRG
jgi:hypothetical protein